jgi:hypothetical protein
MLRRFAAVFLVSLVGATACGKPAAAPSSGAPNSPLSVAVEGPCSKLRVWDAGDALAIVFGTYGLEGATPTEARQSLGTAQAFGFMRNGKLDVQPAFFNGLPRDNRGYVTADIELGGRMPHGAWLARVDTKMARIDKGALFERRRSYLVWEPAGAGNPKGRWTESPAGADVVLSGLRTPPLVEGTICTRLSSQEEGGAVHFARHATERLPSGEVITAGRCEDERQIAKSGVVVATLARETEAWSLAEMPASPMFETIVNVDLVYAKRGDAYLYAYTPYDESPRPPYVMHFDGQGWTPATLPFDGPIVSMAHSDDGTIWAVARFRELFRKPPNGEWASVPLAPAQFSDRVPPDVRIIEVQSTGKDVWVHAAYPIVIRDKKDADPKPGRAHILYTTRAWERPLFCDAASPATEAVRANGRTLEAARSRKTE